MPLSDIVQVNISVSAGPTAQAGFGLAMVLSASTPNSGKWTTPELQRLYSTLDEVLVDFPAASPEALTATAHFSQTPSPAQIMLGKLTSKPEQVATVTVVTGVDATQYSMLVNGELVTFLSISSSTSDIATGLATAGTTASITGLTFDDSGSTVVITAAEGTWLTVELTNVAGLDLGPMGLGYLGLAMDAPDTDTAIATQLATLRQANDDWYALINPYAGKALSAAISTYVETAKKLFVQDDPSTDMITVVVGSATDVATAAQTAGRARTAIMFHQNPRQCAAAAWLGLMLPTQPGSENWAFGTLAGVDFSKLSPTHKSNLDSKSANYYYRVGGTNITYQGTVAAGGGGGYLDIVRGRDWLEARMEERIFGYLKSASPRKIPFTDGGIVGVGAQVRAVLVEGTGNGLIAEKPAPTVSTPLAADISPTNKALRKLTDVRWTASLQGAINKVIPVTGVVTI